MNTELVFGTCVKEREGGIHQEKNQCISREKQADMNGNNKEYEPSPEEKSGIGGEMPICGLIIADAMFSSVFCIFVYYLFYKKIKKLSPLLRKSSPFYVS